MRRLQHVGNMTSSTGAPRDEPSLRTIDFSDNLAVMQVSTAMRRLWLIDPDSLGIGGSEDGAGSESVEAVFREANHRVFDWFAQAPASDRWHDDVWKAQTDLTLLDPPEGPQTDLNLLDPPEGPRAETGVIGSGQGALFTPFRCRVYGVYNHVFWDVYNALKDSTEEEIGELGPRTTVMVLKASDDGSLDSRPHFFPTDTFVYPVWIAPGTTVAFSTDGIENTVSSEGHTWTSSLWFREGTIATITPRIGGRDRDGRVVALLALGACEGRPQPPQIVPKECTIGPYRHKLSEARPWANSGDEEADMDAPEVWPEADHLARAIFLQAGDTVEQCSFDQELLGVDDERKADEEDELLEDRLTDLDTDDPRGGSPLYSALPGDRSFRILVIEPASTEDEDLHTRLLVATLDDKPSYEAISYTWGDPSDVTLLRCNDSRVKVPQNLESALKRLRRATGPRHVWADSVCINQQDIPERGQQVSIMRNIYQNAERVLVWLGLDENNQASTAFTAVCDIVRAWRPDGNRLDFSGYAGLLEPMGDDDLAPIRAAVNRAAWDALRALYETNYFRRFWIIQELALGSSAVVLWGRHRISWGLVGICAAWMLSSGWDFHHGEPITAAYNAFLMYVLPLAKRSGISPFSKLDLSVVLGTTMGRFDSTDARDRIYALLGMPFAGNDPDGQPLLKPDYSQNLRSVYTQAARRILEQDKHLRVLSAVQHGADLDESYPSWVPRWHQPPHAEPLALRDEQGYYANGGELFFPANPEDSPDDDGSTTLHLTGLTVSPITSTSEPLHGKPPTHTALTNPAHRLALHTLLTTLNAEEAQLRASWSATLERYTIVGCRQPATQARYLSGGGGGGNKARSVVVTSRPGKYGMREATELLTGEWAQNDHLGEFLLYWRERASWRAGELLPPSPPPPPSGDDGPWKGLAGGATVYARERALCAVNALRGRRVFVMADGKVGLGPEAMRVGDVVVVLFGGVVPFVLRPVDAESERGPRRRWRLVGECLVPGLMQGEAVEEAGLLAEGTYQRASNGWLALTPTPEGQVDPRLRRRVGEHGVCAFEII